MTKSKYLVFLTFALLLNFVFIACERDSSGKIDAVKITGETSVKINEHINLSATVYPEGVDYSSIKWVSFNEKVATINSSGTVTGISAGEAVVKVSVDGNIATTTIKVTAKEDTDNSGDDTDNPDNGDDSSNKESLSLSASLYGNALTPTIGDWGSGATATEITSGSEPYSKYYKVDTGSNWGVPRAVTAFSELTAGFLSDYTYLRFKVKSTEYSSINVKVPEKEITYAFNGENSTDLGNGWYEMKISLSDFSAEVGAATEFALFNSEDIVGSLFLTDVYLTK